MGKNQIQLSISVLTETRVSSTTASTYALH